MLVYGSGGHAKVVIECLEENDVQVTGLVDDRSEKTLFGYHNYGGYTPGLLPASKLIIAVGDNRIRKRLSEKIQHQLAVVIHPSAEVSKRAVIGPGTVVFHKAIIQSCVLIGTNCIINTAASIDHDCVIGDFAHISPNATLSGNVAIGEGTHIGAGAVVIPNVKIGKWAVVGAGSVIIKDIPDYAVVVGNPGRVIKLINIDE